MIEQEQAEFDRLKKRLVKPASARSDVEIVRRGDFYAVRLLLDIPEGELSPYTRNFTVPVDWRNAPSADYRPWERAISALVAEVLRLRGE